MSWQRILIHHDGRWERSMYVDGDSFFVYIDAGQVKRANLVEVIREGLGGRKETEYVLWYLTHMSNGAKVKVLLRSDIELLRLLVEYKEDPEVYVENGYSSAPEVNVGGSSFGVEHDHDHIDHSMPSRDGQYEEDGEDEEYEEDEVSTSEDEDEDRRTDLLKSLSMEFLAWVRQPAQMERILAHRNFSSDHQSESEPVHATLNWTIPFPDRDSAGTLGWVERTPPERGELVVGSTFRSKEELRITVGMYHLENFLECVADRSAALRMVFLCRSGRENCMFRVCAVMGANIWRITKLNMDHTCHADLNRRVARSVTSEVAAFYFAKRLTGDGVTLRPKEMIAEMRREYGIDILYSFALRTRNIAIENTYGKFDTSYQRIPSYLYLLKQYNPGTVYDLETNSEGALCHMFLALGQCIRAFETCLRPVIIVDGTHLKGRNHGVLFVAVTLDGNEQVFPLAIGLGAKENDDTWTYFLHNLRRCYNPPEDLLIVSDQHKSIQNAVKAVYPNAFHGLCYYHLQKNLTSYGAHTAALFLQAAYCHCHEDFENYFSKLQVESPNGAHRRLSEIGPERWTRSKCPVRRYNFLTSNTAECLNARMVWARRIPVCSMIEMFRLIMEDWFDEKRVEAASRDHELTENTFKKLSSSVDASVHLRVRGITQNIYKVEEKTVSYQVDLEKWTCACREFDLDMIPCRHAVAAIRRAGQGLSVYDFVSPYFKQAGFRETYKEHIHPIPHPDEWNVPPEISSILCLPMEKVRQAGRPRMSRARSTVENVATSRRPQLCGRCKGRGHNRKSCNASIPRGGVDLNIPPEETQETEGGQSRQRNRRKKRCSICRLEDHDIRACPYRQE